VSALNKICWPPRRRIHAVAASLIVFVNRQRNFTIANAALSQGAIAPRNLAELRDWRRFRRFAIKATFCAFDKDTKPDKGAPDAVEEAKGVLDKDSRIANLNPTRSAPNATVLRHIAMGGCQLDMKARPGSYNGPEGF